MRRISSIVVLLVLCCGGGGEKPTEAVSQSEDIATIAESVLMVIAPRDFRDEEFKAPYDLLTKSGVKVVVASTDTTPARGMLGLVVKPDITLEQVNTDDFDGLVVVGGAGCEQLWDNATLHKIVQDFNAGSKLVAAICLAPMVFARAGILQDKIVTAYPSVRDEIGKSCARCTDSDIEVSGNVITCSGPGAAPDFADAILNMLGQ